MNFMFTITTNKDLGNFRRLILKLLKISFVNKY